MDTPVTHAADPLEERIRRVQHMYKVLWTYYQTAQSLLRTLLKLRRLEDIGLDQVYQQLQALDQMADRSAPSVEPVLQSLEAQLQRAHYILAQFDSNISPGVTRRYIERLESFDDRFLVYLIQFLLGKYPMTQDDWDKVDLLLTKLAITRNPKTAQYELRPEAHLLQLRTQITQYYPMPYTPPERVNDLVAEADAIAAEVRKVTSYHDLMEWGLLARIREFKKGVQHLMLHPQLMIPFLRLNLTTKKKFTVLYRQEIERIQASIRLLERTHPASGMPTPEVPPVREGEDGDGGPVVGSGEGGPGPSPLEGEEFVQVLVGLERRMDSIAEMLGSLLRSGVSRPTPVEGSRPTVPPGTELADASVLHVPESLRPEMEALLQAFQRVDWRKSLSEIAFSEALSPYALEPFEVEAFQMGFRSDAVSGEARVAYRLIVLAALCRHVMSRLAREVLGLQRVYPDRWIQHLTRETVERIRAMLDQSEVYESQLSRWQDAVGNGLRRRLSRSLRKLQRARVGLSLVYDQVEEAWSLQVGPVPSPEAPAATSVIRLRSETTSLLTWLGWVVAAALFLLALFLVFRR